ncbi:MAG: altronate dehydratase [Gemmatimonadales bacterium]|nr:altronate dehydratase [Gemmatimonadales bacterium]
MPDRVLRVHPDDNVLVALVPLAAGEHVRHADVELTLTTQVSPKHKFATVALAVGEPIIMYGILVGRAVVPIAAGEAITTSNVRHAAASVHAAATLRPYHPPDVGAWQQRTFLGYHRSDGQVGTRNHWLVIPLVFCENRNVNMIRQAFEEELGFSPPDIYRQQVRGLLERHGEGGRGNTQGRVRQSGRVFGNIDGIKFLTHSGGCGGTREDSRNLCGLLAGYLHHPNVAGATVLSLGCQHAQGDLLREEIAKRAPHFNKPLFYFEQQGQRSEQAMLTAAIEQTFYGLVEADQVTRSQAPLSKLTVGLKCGGSDGFSGITANPAVGHAADLLAALGGTTLLAEFPELCGVEQELIDRCVETRHAERFLHLMTAYNARAQAVGSGFDMNPSPGNIKDGLITDAMKSAGAARKGGSSPVTDVLDYPEYATTPGLNLLCTPGNDVEATTAQVGAGANVVLFTTGLGTPTGNPIAPVVKLATNTALATRMADLIDIDCGRILSGDTTLAGMGEEILELIIAVASGQLTRAEELGQDDFIPWKRGVSL